MADLAEHVLLSRSGMTRLVDRLEREGWSRAARATRTARGCFAVLDRHGREIVDQARATHIAVVRAGFLRHFSEDEMREPRARCSARACRAPQARVPGFEIHHRDPASSARSGTLQLAHGAGPHARLRPARDQGRDQDARGRRGGRARLRHGARQHVPPLPLAGARAGPRARRPAPLHALGPADHHRLRRLPGLLDGPRDGRRRGQGPPGARRAHAARSSRSRRRACASAPTSTAPSASWPRRPRWRSRPRSARTSRSCSTSARRSTSRATTRRARPSAPTAGSTAASPGTPSTARRDQVVYGIVQGGVDEDLRRASAQEVAARDVRRDRDRRLARRGQAADVRGRRLGGRRAAGGAPAPPARDRRRRRPDARRRARDRHLRLRDADADRPPRHGASSPTRARAGASTSPRPASARPTSRCSRAARARRARAGYSRAYLHYLVKAHETTVARLLTIHNLAYLQRADGGAAGGDGGGAAR